MNLIRFCVRRPVFTWVTVILAALLGLYGFFKLGVALYPKVDIPVIVISATYRGASPSEIESLVSKPLEDAVSEVDGVDKIESYSIEGVSFVVAEMKLDAATSREDPREKLRQRYGIDVTEATEEQWQEVLAEAKAECARDRQNEHRPHRNQGEQWTRTSGKLRAMRPLSASAGTSLPRRTWRPSSGLRSTGWVSSSTGSARSRSEFGSIHRWVRSPSGSRPTGCATRWPRAWRRRCVGAASAGTRSTSAR